MTSTIKVNTVTTESGSTLTLGESGKTVTLASGASQSGFGRSGSVNWDTTAKTAGFTGVSGNGYFINTTSGGITVNLPASPSAGDIMGVVDYAGTSASNNITIGRNGSNINGDASDIKIEIADAGVMLVYVDGTQGWKATETSNLNDIELQPEYVNATGGTTSTIGDFKYHKFTGPGTFEVTSAGNSAGSQVVQAMVVAGGGGGTYNGGGGGGAGGFRNLACQPVSIQPYPITVGAGGNGVMSNCSTSGSPAVFSTITSAGGGRGGPPGGGNGCAGGSGGGGGGNGGNPATGGAGNTPPVSPPQGNSGGSHGPQPNYNAGAGGGGSSQAGQTAPSPGTPGTPGGHGGNGTDASPSFPAPLGGTPAGFYAGGGGGGGNDDGPGTASPTPNAPGGGGFGSGGGNVVGGNATANTGGGGGGAPTGGSSPSGSGSGGSGIVIIKYKFQN